MRLTKEELKEACATIFEMMADGKSDKEIMDDIGIPAEDYKALKTAMLDTKSDDIRTRPIEHVYVEYTAAQIANIRDLTGMIGDFKATKQYNAMVGAVRARSDILDKIVKTGQDMGLIKREAVTHKVVGGIVIAELNNLQLRELITKELADLQKMMRKYGEGSIIDVETGPLHYGDALPPRAALPESEGTSMAAGIVKKKTVPREAVGPIERDKHHGGRTAKVSAGRRVVKD